MRFGIDPTKGRWDTDFGQGFYTTTWKQQAQFWAWERYYSTPFSPPVPGPVFPVVLGFRVRREPLAELHTLGFAGGDFDAEGFWSLVQHCRQSQAPHTIHNHKCTNVTAPVRRNWYDVVIGPAAAFWRQRVAMDDADQISFHTYDAVQILNDAIDAWKQSNYQSDVLLVEQVGT